MTTPNTPSAPAGKGLTEEQKANLKKQLGLTGGAMTFDVGLRHHRQAPKVVIPMRLMEMMNFIYHSQTAMGNEYGAFLNCDFDEKTFTYTVNLDREVMVPKQKVTPGHIDFLEIPERERFNTIIHRHPAGVRAFSGTDDEFINKDFEVSILFLPPMDFPTAIVNIPLKGSNTNFVQLKADIVFEFSVEGITGLGELNDNAKFRAHVKENVQPLATVAPLNYNSGEPIPSYQNPAGSGLSPAHGYTFQPVNRFTRGGKLPVEISVPLGNFVDQTATFLYNSETLVDKTGATVENDISELFTYADLIASLTDYLMENHIVESDTLFINTGSEYPGITLATVNTKFRDIIIDEFLADLDAMLNEEAAENLGVDLSGMGSFLDGLDMDGGTPLALLEETDLTPTLNNVAV